MKVKLNFEEEKYFEKTSSLTRTVRGEQKSGAFQLGARWQRHGSIMFVRISFKQKVQVSGMILNLQWKDGAKR
jgi:hypothetical protein